LPPKGPLVPGPFVPGPFVRGPWSASRVPRPASRVPHLSFNLFDTQDVTDYDNYVEETFTEANPDFGRVISYQIPRQLRIGARFVW